MHLFIHLSALCNDNDFLSASRHRAIDEKVLLLYYLYAKTKSQKGR